MYISCRENKTICITGTSIKKTYHGPDGEQCIQKLWNIYNMLRSEHVPNVDDLILSYTDNDHGCVAYLAPKGMSVRPNTQKELLEAIICVLEALSVSIVELPTNISIVSSSSMFFNIGYA